MADLQSFSSSTARMARAEVVAANITEAARGRSRRKTKNDDRPIIGKTYRSSNNSTPVHFHCFSDRSPLQAAAPPLLFALRKIARFNELNAPKREVRGQSVL